MTEVLLARSSRCSGRCCKNWDTRSNRGSTGLKWRKKALNPCGMFKSTPKPLWGIFEAEKIHAAIAPRRTFYSGIRDDTYQAYMVTHSCHHQMLDRMEYAHFPQWASGSTDIHVEHVPYSRNFKLKKQVELTIALTKDPLWRKWNSSKRSMRRQWRPSGSLSTAIPKTWKHILMKRRKSSLQPRHLARWLPVHLQSMSFPTMMMTRSHCSLIGNPLCFASFC
jgi:hypothetical protein